ncbi:uncharacterized protein EDB91DRAFT_1052759, partial [Suillus paluster]|uniref:uncharacterized protein n=1 Tax=Suillus paluster TaxID=48578 RepID=UPI001B87FCF8
MLASLASAAPLASFSTNVLASNSSGFSQEQNGLDAQKLNAQFATLSANDSCTSDAQACVGGAFAQCVGSSWELTPCSSGLSCFALPLVAKAGTSLACDTQSDAEARFIAAGVQGGTTG